MTTTKILIIVFIILILFLLVRFTIYNVTSRSSSDVKVESCFDDVDCESTHKCVNGECVDKCFDVNCTEPGTKCIEGKCIDLCEGVFCVNTHICEPETGECVDKCKDCPDNNCIKGIGCMNVY